jgi:EAL domain-containing protein (putative c-di-GMP-specific phosphodiesterase class I)
MKGVVSIAQALSLEVIVEGIETAEQLRELDVYGVDGIQGFIYARPMDGISLLPHLAYKIKPVSRLTDVNQSRNKRVQRG